MRCKSCDSDKGKWVEAWEDYYCEECSDSIYESLEIFDDEEDFMEGIYFDD
jgi:hypothetical protein